MGWIPCVCSGVPVSDGHVGASSRACSGPFCHSESTRRLVVSPSMLSRGPSARVPCTCCCCTKRLVRYRSLLCRNVAANLRCCSNTGFVQRVLQGEPRLRRLQVSVVGLGTWYSSSILPRKRARRCHPATDSFQVRVGVF